MSKDIMKHASGDHYGSLQKDAGKLFREFKKSSVKMGSWQVEPETAKKMKSKGITDPSIKDFID